MVAYDKRQLPGRTETVNVPVGVAGTQPTGSRCCTELKDPGDSELRLTLRRRHQPGGPDADSPGRETRIASRKRADPRTGAEPPGGSNRFVWDGRHGRGTQIEIDPPEDEDAAANLGPAAAPVAIRCV